MYVFGGFSTLQNINMQSFERLDISSPDSKWELLSLKNESSSLITSKMLVLPMYETSPYFSLNSSQNNYSKFILLGGSNSQNDCGHNSALQVEIFENSEDSEKPFANVKNASYYMEDESFSYRVASPLNFTGSDEINFVIGDSGTCYKVSKKVIDIIE